MTEVKNILHCFVFFHCRFCGASNSTRTFRIHTQMNPHTCITAGGQATSGVRCALAAHGGREYQLCSVARMPT